MTIGTERTSDTRARRFGLASYVYIGTVAVVLAVLGVALVISSFVGRRAARAAERRGLELAADLTAQFLAARGRTIAGGARVFAQGPYFRSLVAQPTHEDMLDQTIEAAEQLEADWVFFTDERGTLLAKSDEEAVAGAPLGSIPLIAGALEGRVTSGFGVSRDTLLFQTVAVPIIVPRAAPIGVLVASKLVDKQLARDVRAATGAEVIFYTLDAKGVPRVAPTSLEHPSDANTALASLESSDVHTARLGETTFALQGARLTTAGGEIVGGFLVARPERETGAEMAGMRRALLAAALLGLVFAAAVARSVTRRVARPLGALAEASAVAVAGDYDRALAHAAEPSGSAAPNEVTRLGAALTRLLQELREHRLLSAALARAPVAGQSGAPTSEESEGGVTERKRGGRSRVSGSSRLRAGSSAVPRALEVGLTTQRPATLPPGTVVAGRYEIQEMRGIGAGGIVYRAIDRSSGNTIALETLRPELGDDPLAREELKREVRRARGMTHRNVVRLQEMGTSEGSSFLTMEYVDGTPLSSVIGERGALPSTAVLALASQLLRALEAAHEHGLVHGDLKPGNLLVTADGRLKVTGFGVASVARRPRPSRSPAATQEDVEAPRLAGALLGTPEYLAPELLVGAAPDARTDLYAAGMVLHECLTGVTPFRGDTPAAFLAQKLGEGAKKTAPLAPGSLEELIEWLTAVDPADRPASATEAVAALNGLSSP